jgi:hypothetical protein
MGEMDKYSMRTSDRVFADTRRRIVPASAAWFAAVQCPVLSRWSPISPAIQ